MTDPIHGYGWTPVPLSFTKLTQEKPKLHEPKPYQTTDFTLPNSPIASQAFQYAKAQLPLET